MFPSNYVIRIRNNKKKTIQFNQQSTDHHNASIKYDVSKKTFSVKARVLYDYKAEADDELTLTVNDIITVLDKNLKDEGWWKVKISKSNKFNRK